jgi:hypothetical protein
MSGINRNISSTALQTYYRNIQNLLTCFRHTKPRKIRIPICSTYTFRKRPWFCTRPWSACSFTGDTNLILQTQSRCLQYCLIRPFLAFSHTIIISKNALHNGYRFTAYRDLHYLTSISVLCDELFLRNRPKSYFEVLVGTHGPKWNSFCKCQIPHSTKSNE